MNIQITVKNYRCFDDENPLRINIDNGFVALVGPNNSGKSSCLKLFYELRNLWGDLSSGEVVTYVNGGQRGVGYLDVHDPEQIFSDTNNRPLIVEIRIDSSELGKSGYQKVSFIRATCQRIQMSVWGCEFFWGQHQTSIASNFNPSEVGSSSLDQHHILKVGAEKFDYADMASVMRDLHQALYVGPFRNAINEGAGKYFDLAIGSSFISTWNQWKTGGVKAQNIAIDLITADIRQIFEYGSLEINASEQLKTLAISINGKPYKLSELGAGLAQFIIVLGNAAIKKPSFVLVDEPELHLHPSLQIDFLTSLASYAKCGIVFATHSIGLARTTASQIYSFQKKDGRSFVKPFEQTPNYAEFMGELSFSTFKEMGCDHILLVEGVSDVKTIQQFLRKIRKDHRVVVIPLGGNQLAKGGVEQELGELTRLTQNISALVDSERTSQEDKPAKQRTAFEVTCKKLGIDVLLTNRRATENYLSDRAIKNVLGEKYRGLGYHELLADCVPCWSKNDNWKIARQMEWAEIKDTDVGRFLEQL